MSYESTTQRLNQHFTKRPFKAVERDRLLSDFNRALKQSRLAMIVCTDVGIDPDISSRVLQKYVADGRSAYLSLLKGGHQINIKIEDAIERELLSMMNVDIPPNRTYFSINTPNQSQQAFVPSSRMTFVKG